MAVVVDASVAVRWLFDLNDVGPADALLQKNEPIIAPDLVLVEMTNTAWKMAIFSSLPAAAAATAILKAGDFFHEIVPASELRDAALTIGLELRHPTYDCFYLALAEQRDCNMVTTDERLLARCARTRFATRVRPLTARSGRRR
jgi:predicted nucleic acid-binding protein